jgi:ribosomal protein S18 acetylase RimI-like enzyme
MQGWEFFVLESREAMADDITIRPVAPPDEDAIARLWQALTDYHVHLDPRLPTSTPGAAENYAARLLERRDDPYTQAFVAEVGGQVVGYILGAIIELQPDLFEYTDSGFIADVYVDPAYRRRGIARQLVETLAAWFAERGVFLVEWQVAARNPDAIHFWESVGGQPLTIRMQKHPDDGA